MTTPRALSDDELKHFQDGCDRAFPDSFETTTFGDLRRISSHISFLNTRIEQAADQLEIDAKHLRAAAARIEELEKEFNAAQKRFETTSELSCERAIEIEELKEQRATLKSENEKLKAENGELRGKADHYSNLFDKLEELSRPSIHSSPWEAVRLACEDGKKYHEGLRELSTLRQLCDDQHKAIEANHKWHGEYDEYGGYPESDLCEQNCKTLAKYNSTKGKQE